MNPRPASRSATVGRLALVWTITAIMLGIAALIIALPLVYADSSVKVTVGESATQEILAPRSLTFVSPALTDKARENAAAAVAEVYKPPDMRVARQQVLLLRDILDFINNVRADTLATRPQQHADLTSIRDLPLTSDTADLILAFNETQWAAVQTEALAVLEQIMRRPIRADQVNDLKLAVPAQISVELSDAQAQAVNELVSGLIIPNSEYDDDATQAARAAARAKTLPIYIQVVTGQAIIQRGHVVTEEDLEILKALGLLQTERNWRDLASVVLAVVITGALLVLNLQRFSAEMSRSPKHILLLGVLFNLFLVAAVLMVPGHIVLPFLFPAAALSMLLTVMAGPNLAVVVSVAMAALVGYIGGNRLELTIYTAIGGLISALALGRAERVNQFFWAGLAGALANAGIVLVFRINDPATDGWEIGRAHV